MKSFGKFSIVFSVLAIFIYKVSSETEVVPIVLKEEDFVGHCYGKCYTMPTLYDTYGCRRIENCRVSQFGYVYWFVRCDYCECDCLKTKDQIEFKRVKSKIIVNENALWQTCGNTCTKSGIYRTNYGDCSVVDNCYYEGDWYSNGYACDYCKCDCEHKVLVKKYQLMDIKYDTDDSSGNRKEEEVTVKVIKIRNPSSESLLYTKLIHIESLTKVRVSILNYDYRMAWVTMDSGVTVGSSSISSYTIQALRKGYSFRGSLQTQSIANKRLYPNITMLPNSVGNLKVMASRSHTEVPFIAQLVKFYNDQSNEKENGRIVGKLKLEYTDDFKIVYQQL